LPDSLDAKKQLSFYYYTAETLLAPVITAVFYWDDEQGSRKKPVKTEP